MQKTTYIFQQLMSQYNCLRRYLKISNYKKSTSILH